MLKFFNCPETSKVDAQQRLTHYYICSDAVRFSSFSLCTVRRGGWRKETTSGET
jgi:hypothetical protein